MPSCGWCDEYCEDSDTGGFCGAACANAFTNARRDNPDEEERADPNVPTSSMRIPNRPTRTSRLLSFEQEVWSGGGRAAEALYNGGFIASPTVDEYHCGSRDFCHVEHDASVDAEIIWSRLRLSDAHVARKFQDGLIVVRELVHSGSVLLNLDCGGHMHVDASGVGVDDLMTLYVLWNHLEDVLFALAGANWSGHRSVMHDNSYSLKIRKELSTPSAVVRAMSSDRDGLNFSPLLAARARCRCGATLSGDWASCTCMHEKETIEFRLWNTTVNLKKVHAYSALSISLVEWAVRNRATVSDFPATSSNMSLTLKNVQKPWRFIMEELALTARERASVGYCARNSELAHLL